MKLVTQGKLTPCLTVFMIGQDSRGNWVVTEARGLRGGVFVGRAEALRYVRSESGGRPSAVVAVNEVFELDTSGMGQPRVPNRLNVDGEGVRRVA
jgi:hypothetical protein